MQSKAEHSTRYVLNAEDEIVEVDSGWKSFAQQNDAPGLADDSVLGKSIWNFIADEGVKEIYRSLMSLARARQRSVGCSFRCDSPTVRRYMELRIDPLPDENLLKTTTLIREEERPAAALLAPAIERTQDWVYMCSWCKKVQLDDGSWTEVDEAINELDLLDETKMRRVSHSICDSCYDALDAKITEIAGAS